ncbi:SMI1 / KNR4 family (SUKH-1) [Paenibacillus algorifonticola]|uniref:SMI1 / KNR4 family (SUKH-1) n=1 Tax=Paenibacillus algorifonticola TaxID=684063 RepID=A0A1I2EFS7_9BACL|nr:SMI1/KNR4 family protein [Paenibacillus algorifonticola]SFE91725.1 SMI1 / KNR4 family (SUKH-1) [Paenibacillus algorifonticola]
MTRHKQLERIKQKLKDAALTDADHQLFGAKSHKYAMNSLLSLDEIRQFEQANGVILPEEFSAFLMNIGNGGAGPYYGIHPLGKKQVIDLDRIAEPFPLQAEMTKEQWETEYPWINGECVISDEEYEEASAKLFQGLLNIGEQGCTYEMMLVVTGKHRGRVVYIDLDYQKPFVTYEAHFLDWYERWLDEVIAGYVTDWFGMRRGGDDKQLIELYQSTAEERVKIEALDGMFKLKAISQETINFLITEFAGSSTALRSLSMQVLAKMNFAEAEVFIRQELTSSHAENRLRAIQCIHWYMPKGDPRFNQHLIALLPKESDEETFRFICYILQAGGVELLPMLQPFFKHPNEEIRVQAVYQAGQSDIKADYLADFMALLDDPAVRVQHITLQALAGVTDPRLLPIYERLLKQHETDKDYIRSNIERRLEEFPYNSKEQLDKVFSSVLKQVGKLFRKKL